MSNTDTQTSAAMHNSFIEPNQLQNFPDRKILKETLHRFISDYVLCYTRSVPSTSALVVAVSFILIQYHDYWDRGTSSMIKRDTEFQPVLPLEFPDPGQFPMLIPTRIFPL